MARDPAPSEALQHLLEVMAALRGPAGCPWDRAQTHESLLPYLVEEACEFIEAVETGDAAGLREELGDVLLQVVFHAQLAAERGEFAFADVAAGLAAKLVERHPHVFGDERYATAEEVHRSWNARKMQARSSHLEGIPAALPALQQAGKVGARAAQAGFEWGGTGEILDKIAEEVEELRAEIAAAEAAGDGSARAAAREMELGDLLFAVAQLARWQRIDPEAALRRATRKFAARFRFMEERLRVRGADPAGQAAADWWALWREAKAAEP